MITPPPWYDAAERFLGSQGWPFLVVAGLVVIAVTAWLILSHQALPLAAWLTYLYMP